MKKFKPVLFLIPKNTNDMFVDVGYLNEWRKDAPFNEHYYGGLILEFGKSVFVFDVNACDFFFLARYVGGEPKMEICEIEEV